jgi:acetoin utilization protein AcuB
VPPDALEKIDAFVRSAGDEQRDSLGSRRTRSSSRSPDGRIPARSLLLQVKMRISDWMKGSVRVIGPRDSVRHARSLLERHRINQLPVVDDGRLVGIVAERDLRAASPNVNVDEIADVLPEHEGVPRPDRIPVETLMTRKVIVLHPGDTVEEAARLMRARRIAALPIVEGERVVGVLTRGDVIDAFLAQAEQR